MVLLKTYLSNRVKDVYENSKELDTWKSIDKIQEHFNYDNNFYIDRNESIDIFYRFIMMNNSEKVKVPRNIFLITGCRGIGKTWLMMKFLDKLKENGNFFVFIANSEALPTVVAKIFNVSDSLELAKKIREHYLKFRKSIYFIIDDISLRKTPENTLFFKILENFKQFKGIAFIFGVQRSYFNFNPFISESYGYLRRSIFYGNREPTTQRLISVFLDIFNDNELKSALKKYHIKIKSKQIRNWFKYPFLLRMFYENPNLIEEENTTLKEFILETFSIVGRRNIGEKITQKMSEVQSSKEKRIHLDAFKEDLTEEDFLEIINYPFFEVTFENKRFFVRIRESFE
ncbi:MAG: ATP-binding protein [Candidatus Asgardarchaeia archaeon]